jgi:type IV pilus assembly protein PilO
MNEIISKLLKLKTPQKVAVTMVAALVLGGIYYQFFYADLSDSITSEESSKARLTQELTTYEQRKIEYLAYRNELKQLQEEQRELLRVLPKRDELASFLSSIQEQAELAGLEIPVFAPDAEVAEDLYVKIPVKMEVRGTFHSITKFFKSVSDMRRIVTVEDLGLIPERDVKSEGQPLKLKAKFIASTYRYQDPSEQKAGGGS